MEIFFKELTAINTVEKVDSAEQRVDFNTSVDLNPETKP